MVLIVWIEKITSLIFVRQNRRCNNGYSLRSSPRKVWRYFRIEVNKSELLHPYKP